MTGSDGSYEDSSVAIRDDRTGAFTVTFKKLQMKDTAWYWCSAGQQQTAVHVLVTPQPTTGRQAFKKNKNLRHLLSLQITAFDAYLNMQFHMIHYEPLQCFSKLLISLELFPHFAISMATNVTVHCCDSVVHTQK